MPWDTIGYDRTKYGELMDKFGINGIPTLVLLKNDGTTAASTSARGDIGKGPSVMLSWIE